MSKKQKLTKSILCAVMAASVVSISGNAFAYTAIDPDQNQGLIYSDDGKDTKGTLIFTNSNIDTAKDNYEAGSMVAEGNAEIIKRQ